MSCRSHSSLTQVVAIQTPAHAPVRRITSHQPFPGFFRDPTAIFYREYAS